MTWAKVSDLVFNLVLSFLPKLIPSYTLLTSLVSAHNFHFSKPGFTFLLFPAMSLLHLCTSKSYSVSQVSAQVVPLTLVCSTPTVNDSSSYIQVLCKVDRETFNVLDHPAPGHLTSVTVTEGPTLPHWPVRFSTVSPHSFRAGGNTRPDLSQSLNCIFQGVGLGMSMLPNLSH